MIPDTFLEYYYGKHKVIDLHNMVKEDAKIALIYEIDRADFDIDSLVIIHGYHGGVTIKNLVRKEFTHPRIERKENLDAGRTIYILKK